MTTQATHRHADRGLSLLEVLVAIAIFSIGLLALFALQGSLFRSASDAGLRTVAVNIAEDTIERQRGFSRLSTDPNGIERAYEDIRNGQFSVDRAGIGYTVNVTVQDYWWNRQTRQFTSVEPLVAAISDFKRMTVNVAWGAGPGFQVDATQGNADLGSGSVTLTELISSITSAGDAKSATGGTGGLYLPSINYTPGRHPEIISISLGENKFKESTTPQPKVIRTDSLAETTFDVVTYSQNDLGATFLRREEFRAISCECSLRVPSTDTQGGLRPTIWNGNDYTRGEFVRKTYGVSTSNIQSKYCSICCRDHHDGGTGAEDQAGDPGRGRYDPFRPGTEYWTSGTMSGDHKHYFRNSSGGLTVASASGSAYMEACRMVRRNGFWQVAQNLRQEGLNVFPEDYLNNTTEVGVYSDYVTSAVSGYETAINGVDAYELNPPALTPPESMSPAVVFPATTASAPTTLPTPLGNTSQQLRARGVYLDYMSDDLRAIVDCLQQGDGGETCGAPNITSPLEVIPFYDVQLTWLARWNEAPANNPVDVTNQAIQTSNAHSRGLAMRTLGTGLSQVDARIHRYNLGLTGTDPIDPLYQSNLRARQLYVHSQNATPPPALNQFLVSGLIASSISGFKASDVEISFTGAQCNRTNTGFVCLLETAANNPRITVTNYYKSNDVRVACSSSMLINGSQTGANGWTRFNLPTAATTTADIVIRRDTC